MSCKEGDICVKPRAALAVIPTAIVEHGRLISEPLRLYNSTMAFANPALIEALRATATRLRDGAPYAWGHHGQCNCGNLAQVITPFTAAEIQRYAHTGAGEWTELAEDYCESTGAPFELVLHKLLALGLTPTDLHHIEYLDDKSVLQHLEGGFRWLTRNRREDAIAYFEAMADMLESQLLNRAVANALREVNQPEPVAAL